MAAYPALSAFRVRRQAPMLDLDDPLSSGWRERLQDDLGQYTTGAQRVIAWCILEQGESTS